jgi:hypothetical protein
MRWPVVIVLVAALTAGCHTPPRKDLVEAELRVKDADLRDLKAELERSAAYNQSLERELRNMQQALPTLAVAEAVSANRVKSISLGRATGGIDDDGVPGDEAVLVVLEPRDGDNHVVKAPGMVQIQTLEVSPEGIKKPLSTWQIDPDTLRRSWRSALFGTGYYLTLPWKNWPASNKLRVVVQFVGQDDRLFEAEKDVEIRLSPEAYRKASPSDGPVLPLAPHEGDVLPPPRPVEPEKKEIPVPEKKEGSEQSISEKPLAPPAPSLDPERPLKGACQLLTPIVVKDD